MGSDVWPASPSSGASTGIASALARAQALLGTSINAAFGTDFDSDQWPMFTIAGSASGTMSQASRAGVVVMTTGAASGSTLIMRPHGAPSLLAAVQTDKWYAVSRAQLTTTPDAQALVVPLDIIHTPVGVNVPSVQLGALGDASTALFSARIFNQAATATTVVSTVAIDTSWHTWEAWSNGTNVLFAIDGVTIASLAATNLGTGGAATLGAVLLNGTTAAAQTLNLDSTYLCCASN